MAAVSSAAKRRRKIPADDVLEYSMFVFPISSGRRESPQAAPLELSPL
jgi:hypothetical protein